MTQVDDVVTTLRRAGSVFADEEAELLIASAASPIQLSQWISRRVEGYPLEHIMGWAEFRGLRLKVDPGVFVPRRRTGLLVELAAKLATPDTLVTDAGLTDSALPGALVSDTVESATVVVDLCCGSGAVAAALAAELPDAKIFASDVDPVSVGCARRNLPASHVFEGDLYSALPDWLEGNVNILVANAPYVPTEAIGMMPPEARLFENPLALDGGPDGLDVQRRVIAGAWHWLAPGGHLVVETSERQVLLTAQLFAEEGFAARIMRSEQLGATAVVGTRLAKAP